MAIPEARKESLLAYCRVDLMETGEEALFDTLYDSALSYMAQAGISEPVEGSARRGQYELCVNALVLDAYERRGVSITGTIVADNPAFRRLMNQLKRTEPVPHSGTGTGA